MAVAKSALTPAAAAAPPLPLRQARGKSGSPLQSRPSPPPLRRHPLSRCGRRGGKAAPLSRRNGRGAGGEGLPIDFDVALHSCAGGKAAPLSRGNGRGAGGEGLPIDFDVALHSCAGGKAAPLSRRNGRGAGGEGLPIDFDVALHSCAVALFHAWRYNVP